jgi:choline dehydrogenase-like flavoprotein
MSYLGIMANTFPRILKKYFIETVVDLPSVGENLQDQINVLISASANGNFTGYPAFATSVNADDLFGMDKDSVYQQTLSELPSYATQISEASHGALSASNQERLLLTQLDLIFNQSTPVAEILSAFANSPVGGIVALPFWGLLPFSRGSVHLSSNNISAPPAINPNFFMLEWDRKLQVAAARLARKFLTSAPLSNIIQAELAPGAVVPTNASEGIWIRWMKDNCNFVLPFLGLSDAIITDSPNYHPVGTAAMLPKELGGVVDHELKLYGTSNVRIVDASVLPFQVCGHLTSTLYAVAEKAADIIKAT